MDLPAAQGHSVVQCGGTQYAPHARGLLHSRQELVQHNCEGEDV